MAQLAESPAILTYCDSGALLGSAHGFRNRFLLGCFFIGERVRR